MNKTLIDSWDKNYYEARKVGRFQLFANHNNITNIFELNY